MHTKSINYWSTAEMLLAAMLLLLCFGPVSVFAQDKNEPTFNLTMEARLSADEPPIESGLQWRIFTSTPDEKGQLSLLAKAIGGTKSFKMSKGEYLIHVAYGYAGVVRRVAINEEDNTQVFVLNAGGLQLEAITSPDGPISSSRLRFDVFSAKADDRGIRPLIARNVRPMKIIPFAQGTYHVVSRYGRQNVETRADLRVQAGKLTQATMQHRAALMSFRLVRRTGSDAIANTSWSILAENGDVIKESTAIFLSLVLAEGNYTAIARNDEKIYSHDFKVSSGLNRVIEVLAE